MSWDAYAITRLEHRREFEAAAEGVIARAGSVDAGLREGALWLPECAKALSLATDCGVYPDGPPPKDGDWHAERVRDLAKTARWEMAEVGPVYVESAKAFLETCAAIGAGVRFSW